MLTIEDREEICMGICAVAAFPDNQCGKFFRAFELPPIVQCVHRMFQEADDARNVGDQKLASPA